MQFYRTVKEDLAKEHYDMTNDTIDKYTVEKLIPHKIGDALKTCNPKTPRFYMLPKVLKCINLTILVDQW